MSATPLFIGLDLAWSSRHTTGAAALELPAETEPARLVNYEAALGDNTAILAWLAEVAPAPRPALLAIDAPLAVPNLSGARPGDKLITRVFGRYQAGTHPANRTNLGRYGSPVGDIRGETLVARLVAEQGFNHNPFLEARAGSRQLFECYPHPAMVVLFDLTVTLKYKRKLRGQDNDRHVAYATLQTHLANLTQATPALTLPAALLGQDTRTLRGAALKHYEDLLDGIVCAYIALYYWWWGPARVHVFGDQVGGYIVSPVTPALRELAVELAGPNEEE